jgi:hypothetical protein
MRGIIPRRTLSYLLLALIATGCAPAAVYVSAGGRTTEYTGSLVTDGVAPLDLVACFVPDTYESLKEGRRYAVNSWIAGSNARAFFTDVRANFEGLDAACDLKLVVNTMNADLEVFAARSGRRLFALQRAFGVDPMTRLGPALYYTLAADPKLIAGVQAERSVTTAQRPAFQSRPSSPPAAAAPTPAGPASDVDTPPAGRAKPNPNAYAVVIGIESYRQQLPKADFAAHDAKVMSDYLTKAMGYEEENVAVLLNDRAAKADVEKYVEHWLPKRVEPGASVFIYYSGHGAPNPKTGDAYLVPYDGDPAFVEATGYPLKRLYDALGKLPAKEVVVMLDSCFSGAGGRSVIAKGMRPMGLTVATPVAAGGKTVVLAASSGEQVSSTYDQKSHGLLTYFFLKGLQGEADGNKDGSVDLAELFAYVKPQVERKARRDFNNEQTPQLLGNSDRLAKGVRLVERAAP